MTSIESAVQKAVLSSERIVSPAITTPDYHQTRLRFTSHHEENIEALSKILKRLSGMDLPGKEHVESYLRYLTRRNRKPRTLHSRYEAIVLFIGMIRDNGRTRLEEITKKDLEVFIEHEQDRGNKITTIRTKLVSVQAFLRYLMEEEIVSADIFRRRIRLRLPERLPKAIDPEDLQKFLSVIKDTRDRAMILILLRTGMRIGELLNTKVMDVHMKERKIEIYEGEKNRLGRVVYLSEDAVLALRKWLKERDTWEEYLFYSPSGGTDTMPYSTARLIFHKHIAKAGLVNKGYSLHALRHTFATELLNAGMRLECLWDTGP